MKFRLFALILITLFSCENDSEEPRIDKEMPVVQVFSPVTSTTFAQEDTVFIKAQIMDNDRLRKIYIHIHDLALAAPADTVFSYQFSLNVKEVEIDTFWIVNDPLDKTYSVYVEGLDRSENLSRQIRFFNQRH
jgi:Domain of unknown function (DUF4625)